jgi:hypothetical protein
VLGEDTGGDLVELVDVPEGEKEVSEQRRKKTRTTHRHRLCAQWEKGSLEDGVGSDLLAADTELLESHETGVGLAEDGVAVTGENLAIVEGLKVG